MKKNVWGLLVFVSLLFNPAASSSRLERDGEGRTGWASSGYSHGGFSSSGSSSFHLGLGGLYKGILHALGGKGGGRGPGGGSGGHNIGGPISFDGDLEDGSVSAHGSISLRSILKTIFSLPFKLPQRAFKSAIRLVWNIATLNIAIFRVPVSAVKKTVTFILGIIKTVVRTILNVVNNINSLNIDIIVGIIGRIESFVAWAIRGASSVQIFGIRAGFNIATFFRDRLEGVVDGGLKLVAWILAHVSESFQGTFRVLHVKQILNLPGVSAVVGMVRWARNFVFDIVCDNVKSVGKFVDGIIYQHQDFFIPIFRYVLNFILAIVNAYHQIQGGGMTTGIQATLGNFHITLGPLLSGFWKIRGIGGKTFGNDGNLSLSGEKCSPGNSRPGGKGGSGGNEVLGGFGGRPFGGFGGRPFGWKPSVGGTEGFEGGAGIGSKGVSGAGGTSGFVGAGSGGIGGDIDGAAGKSSGYPSGSGETTGVDIWPGGTSGGRTSSVLGLGTSSSGSSPKLGESIVSGLSGTSGKGSSDGSSDISSSSSGLSIPSGPGKGLSNSSVSGHSPGSSSSGTQEESSGSGVLFGLGGTRGTGSADNSGGSESGDSTGSLADISSATGGSLGTGSSSLHGGGGLSGWGRGSIGKKGGLAGKFNHITGLDNLGGSSGSGGSLGISGGLSVNGGKPKKFHKEITL